MNMDGKLVLIIGVMLSSLPRDLSMGLLGCPHDMTTVPF
jgi:hypothetical protein